MRQTVSLSKVRGPRMRINVNDRIHLSETRSTDQARCVEYLNEKEIYDRTLRIPSPYTAEGLYAIFAAGFLPTPYLWECREEFPKAVQWRTRLHKGAVVLIDEAGQPMPSSRRLQLLTGAVH